MKFIKILGKKKTYYDASGKAVSRVDRTYDQNVFYDEEMENMAHYIRIHSNVKIQIFDQIQWLLHHPVRVKMLHIKNMQDRILNMKCIVTLP